MARKKIVIGETYIFDVLNETNMAEATTLVTVIKKVGHNKYMSMSVNNGDLFVCKSKYLTPYNPKEATCVRCQYGVTDFVADDLTYFDYIINFFGYIEKVIKEDTDDQFKEQSNLLLKDIDMVKEWHDKLKSKISKYINISSYKEYITLCGNVYKKLNKKSESEKKDDKEEISDEDKGIFANSDFEEAFNDIIDLYDNDEIELDEMIDKVKYIMEKFSIKSFQYINNKNPMSVYETKSLAYKILTMAKMSNTIQLIIGFDNSGNSFVEPFCYDAELSDEEMLGSIEKFMEDIYPELKTKGECYPKYKFAVIAIIKREDDDDE